MNSIFFWINNARYKALPQSLLPAILSVCLASKTEGFSFYLGILAVIGVVIGHLGINLFDDYFDYKAKKSIFRENMARKGFRVRIGKCYYLTSGKATLKQLFVACIVFCSISLGIGVLIWYFRDSFILYFALIIATLGIFYSGPPFRLSYRGLGELIIGIIFGPLLMLGVYYASCGKLDFSIVFISIPIGLLVTNIVYVHSIMDFEPDKEVGKVTLAVLLRDKRWILFFIFCFLFFPFGCILKCVMVGYLSIYYLWVFLTFPMAFSLFYLMVQFIYHPNKKNSPCFWMGPMENWQQMKALGLDWFLIRWFLARNLLSFFCLIMMFVCLIT